MAAPRRKPPEQIEAEPLKDYHGPGRAGEPFFAPGGLIRLAKCLS